MTPEQARGLTALLKDLYGEGPAVARAELLQADLPGRIIPIQLLVPSETPRGLIAYYHGGGWVIGQIDEFENLGRQLAVRTGCAVALVDYRKAPEYPYPAAVEDAWAALVGRREHGAAARCAGSADHGGRQRRRQPGGRPRPEGPPGRVPAADADSALSGDRLRLRQRTYIDPENQLLLTREA